MAILKTIALFLLGVFFLVGSAITGTFGAFLILARPLMGAEIYGVAVIGFIVATVLLRRALREA